jgi:DNA-directed RNA polymerase subunit M/transcription elongation factor TFIIS
MKLDNVDLHASPFFTNATCPKDRSDMIEIKNGWYSVCWYCKKCEYPYELEMRKMRNVNQENLDKLLAEHSLISSHEETTRN